MVYDFRPGIVLNLKQPPVPFHLCIYPSQPQASPKACLIGRHNRPAQSGLNIDDHTDTAQAGAQHQHAVGIIRAFSNHLIAKAFGVLVYMHEIAVKVLRGDVCPPILWHVSEDASGVQALRRQIICRR